MMTEKQIIQKMDEVKRELKKIQDWIDKAPSSREAQQRFQNYQHRLNSLAREHKSLAERLAQVLGSYQRRWEVWRCATQTLFALQQSA